MSGPTTRPSSGLTDEDLLPYRPPDYAEEQEVSSLGNWITDFLPDENATHEKMRNWRKRLALVACSNWLFTFVILVPASIGLLFTGAPILGRVAYGNEVDAKIEAAIRPIQKQLAEVDSKVSQQSALLAEQVTAALASNICRYAVRRTKETDVDERARLLTQIQEMRQKYAKYAGIEFNMSDC